MNTLINRFNLIDKYATVTLYRSYGILSFLAFFAFNVHAQECKYEGPLNQPRGKLETSFKVMTTNIWGQHIDSWVEGLRPFNDGDCEERHRRIGKFILNAKPEYDIIGFQEWHPDTKSTCDGEALRGVIDDRYQTPTEGFYTAPNGHEWGQFRWGHPEAFGQIDGGTGLISKTPFLWETYNENDFAQQSGQATIKIPVKTKNVQQFTPTFSGGIRARSAHGFIFARIFLRYPDIAVDTYVVHLNSTGSSPNKCNLACKQGMLKQLREGIHERSATGGFPVLIMGDFNIGGPNSENRENKKCNGNEGYAAIMEQLGNPKDVWLEAHPNVTGTTHMDETAQRIDFMFIPDDPYLVNSPFEITLKMPITNQKKDWTVSIRDWNGDSDHNGLEADLEIRQKLNWATVTTIIY
ncbi:MAG: endonuclease/exonuclease/phosphatase family protein [Saprospiraceae bacterium]